MVYHRRRYFYSRGVVTPINHLKAFLLRFLFSLGKTKGKMHKESVIQRKQI